MDMQNVTDLTISEGTVRTIHDSSDRLLWGKLSYNTYYGGDTKQQTYSGKNKISFTPYYTGANLYNREPGEVYPNTTSSNVVISSQTNYSITFTSTSANAGVLEVSNPLNEGDTYVLTATLTASGSIRTTVYTLNSSHEIVRKIGNVQSSQLETTVTMQSGELYIAYAARGNEVNYTFTIENLQLEVGSTATPYEPYVGGVPAPNPDYPQTVNVVTGEQTITINSEAFTLNLGTMELCKIGNYQDYIYKSGNDWYVCKEIKKVILDGTETWEALSQYSSFFTFPNPDAMLLPTREIGVISDNFMKEISTTSATQWGNYLNNCIALRNRTTSSQIGIKTDEAINADAFKTWLTTHNTTVYYVLATPTNTKITDTTLILQLNDINEWLTRYGYTYLVAGNLPLIIIQNNL